MTTAAASSPVAATLNRMQIDADEGPCLVASTRAMTLNAENLAGEPRWPTFGPAATAVGFMSTLACSLYATRSSALNFYARSPAAFDADDRAQAQLFATLARSTSTSPTGQLAAESSASRLTEALRTGRWFTPAIWSRHCQPADREDTVATGSFEVEIR